MATSGPRARAGNRLCFLVDGVGWPLGQSFLSANTILPMFVVRLAGNNLLVGLVAGIQSAGQLLPQLLSSHWVERLRVLRRYVVTVGILVERLPIAALAAAILLDAPPAALLKLFFACWALVNVGTGINMPAFFTLFSKSIPPAERAGLVGAGNAAGTLLASAGALVARRLLQSGDGLHGYAWCFLIGVVVLVVTVIPLGFVGEPPQRAAETRSLSSHLREIPGLLRSDRRFGVYVAMQVALQFAAGGIGFLTGYAVLELHAAEALVALGSALMLGAEAFGSVVLGATANRGGCRPVFVVGAASAVLLYGVMAFSPPIGVVLAAWTLFGLLQSALAVGTTMTLDFAPPSRTATFTAVVFFAMAPVRVAGPIVLGALADAAGTRPVFAVVAAASAAALYLAAARLEDPRRAASAA